jgi:moderate conductance mechanosensitive channel
MNWSEIFSSDRLLSLAAPVGTGLAVVIIMLVLRHILYRYIRRLSARTKTCFDDILIRDTRLASFLWCIGLGIYAGLRLAAVPESWIPALNTVVPVIFVALGIYTATVIIVAVFKWYREEVCPRTKATIDDMIMSTLIIGAPVVGAALGIILILKMLGYENLAVTAWLSEHLARIAFLVILGIALLLLTIAVVPRVIRAAVVKSREEQTQEEMTKRVDTLTSVVVTTLQVIIIFVFIVMIIIHFTGAEILAPLLTATGVVGIAVGFGAQSLVRDVFAGLFIIMENQYRKGDVVKIASTSGVVEEINLRRTILRDMDGITHVVPNGEIRVASNYTKQRSAVNMNIGVSYDTDLDKAIRVINRVGKELSEDPLWLSSILSPPRALRVDNLGESSVDIKIVGETRPSRQWDVMGELRLRIKKAFDQEGIEIPWPHTKVYFGNSPIILQSRDEENKVENPARVEKEERNYK